MFGSQYISGNGLTPGQRADAVYLAIIGLKDEWFDKVNPLVMLGQAFHESNGFTSNLTVSYNNVFGLKYPSQRPTTAIDKVPAPDGGYYSVFANLHDCVLDYLGRQRYWGIPNTSDDEEYMMATAESGYATDPNYLVAWRANVPDVFVPGGYDVDIDIDMDDPPPVVPGVGVTAQQLMGAIALTALAVVVVQTNTR